ncbi:MAG: hypothetical protein J6O18_03145 [Bacilli bacterium]|nr:hypothetical protein [Bacilli bacterium]
MSAQKGKPNSRRKTNILIAINTMFVIFGLASGFTGTMAWFNSQRATELTASSFSISALPGTEFDLYYLDYFVDTSGNKIAYGNWNGATYQFSGYEVSFENAHFSQVTYDENGAVSNCYHIPDPEGGEDISVPCNPTNIDHLWPAHAMTFAMYVTQGGFSGLSLDKWAEDWGEAGSPSDLDRPMVDADTYIRLSWAIDIYGWAYRTNGDIATALSANYSSYRTNASVADAFSYSEELPALMDDETGDSTTPVSIVPSSNISGSGSKTIVFFTIAFSNESSTFYKRSMDDPYYYSQDEVRGDSNCYEGLRLTKLEFALK